MAHFGFIAEGLMEGQGLLMRELDCHDFGHGACRLRPMLLYNLQCPQEDKAKILSEFAQKIQNVKAPDVGLSNTFKYRENPFQHKVLRRALHDLVMLGGWPLGMEPIGEVEPSEKLEISRPWVNIYPIGWVNDNVKHCVAYNKDYEML
jgi:hypothetical protein